MRVSIVSPRGLDRGASRALLAVLAALTTTTPLPAQPWITRHQDAMWVGAFVDKPVTKRVALWFDGSWRRMDFGQEPQQLLLRPGVQVTLTPGIRVAAGYGYIASAPYGNLPAANPSREHRLWQQLLLTHRAGAFSVSHRYRLEQRWVHPLLLVSAADDERDRGPASYQNRLRYQGRGQRDLPGLRIGTRPVIAFAWDELLMPLGGANQSFTIGQNRATLGIGLPFTPTMRAEVGYMNLYNAYPSRRANEVNHTLWVSWHYTGAAR